jgi:hypothetical protein
MGGGILGGGLGKAARSGADGWRRHTSATKTRLRSSVSGKRGEMDGGHHIFRILTASHRHLLLVCAPCHSCVLMARGTVQLFLAIGGELLRGTLPRALPFLLFHPFLIF